MKDNAVVSTVLNSNRRFPFAVAHGKSLPAKERPFRRACYDVHMATKPNRRWLRFNLSTLLLAITVFCVYLAWQVDAPKWLN